MVRTASTMLPLGTPAPDFSLPDYRGRVFSLDDFDGKPALVIVFMCNHCPYVKHVAPELVKIVQDYEPMGVQFVGINANDAVTHPHGAPDKMGDEAIAQGYTFPYLFDATQQIAKAYQAACTPDFFVFDAQRELVYRGQMDDSRPKSDQPRTGLHLRTALDCVLSGKSIPDPQKPSVGCNIKWKSGASPEYFDPIGVQ